MRVRPGELPLSWLIRHGNAMPARTPARKTTARKATAVRRATPARTAAKKPAAKKRAAPARPPAPLLLGPGEHLWLLDVPFAMRAVASENGAHWSERVRAWVHLGRELPPGLQPFVAPRFSWQEWREREMNGLPPVEVEPDGTVIPRPYQSEAADAAEASWAAGRPGFLEGDETGLGKTVVAGEIIRRLPGERVLITCPLSAVAHWRRTLAAMGTHGKRFAIVPFGRLPHLVSEPAAAAQAVKRKTKNKLIASKGRSLVAWDLVVVDEAHAMKNPTRQRSALVRTLSKGAFVVWMSATAGTTPLELSYLAPLLGELTGEKVDDLEKFEAWCASRGIGVERRDFGKWQWKENEADLDLMCELLYGGQVPGGIRRRPSDIAGWPELLRIPWPVALEPAERVLYNEAWTEFRRAMRLAQRGRDSSNGMVARTRFRQKASFIRVPGTVQFAEDLLDSGNQVAISVVWRESLEAIASALEAKGVAVSRYHGGMSAQEREAERLRFQRGTAQVCVFSVSETISLHANEEAVGGNCAPRTQIDHDLRYSGIEMTQVDGRTHRDGQNANVYWAFAEGTVEEKIVPVLLGRVKSMKRMSGDDLATVKVIEDLLAQAALAPI